MKAAGIPYGDSFHAVGNMKGPGVEPGSRGDGEAVYFFDPNQHLIEIRHYGPDGVFRDGILQAQRPGAQR